MADAGEISVKVVFITGALLLLAVVGLGLWYFFAPRAEMDEAAGPNPERTDLAEYQNEEARDSLRRRLVLTHYDLERAPAVVSGTVVNNTDQPFVDVQVGFRLFNASGGSVGTVRDTTSIVEADDTWNFRISLPPEKKVARVEATGLQGAPKPPLGPNPRTVRRPEDAPGTPAQDGAGQRP